jgi:HEAT repeat protein
MRCKLVILLLVLALSHSVEASNEGVWFINEHEQYAQDEAARSVEHDRAREAYEAASKALDRRDWDQAIDHFRRVIELNGQRVDASFYWLGYSLNKTSRRAEALAALAELQGAEFSGSRWRDEARRLEMEIREAAGQPVSPDMTEDEELKLLIINNLIHTDPDRAVPMLEKLLQAENPLKIKERALFVLAQSGTERGYSIIADHARGAGGPELQMKAVEYLGIFGNGQAGALLEDVYRSTDDESIRRRILQSFMIAGESERILTVARTEDNPRVRMKAIELLGVLNQTDALSQLYDKERDEDIKRRIIQSFMIAGASDRLQQIARSGDATSLRLKAIEQLGILNQGDVLWDIYGQEQDMEVREAILTGIWLSGDVERLIEVAQTDSHPELRRDAIEKLGISDGARAEQALMSLYQKETDDGVKRKLLEAMFLQHNVEGLIQIARVEKDPGLRRSAVEKLSIMGSDEATDFLLELLDQ